MRHGFDRECFCQECIAAARKEREQKSLVGQMFEIDGIKKCERCQYYSWQGVCWDPTHTCQFKPF